MSTVALHHPLALVALPGLLFLWVIHADGELAGFCAVLVLDQQGVFARVRRGDGSDCDAGKLAVLELEVVVVVAHQHLFVLRPAHLRYGIAPHVASQVQGLEFEKKKNVSKRNFGSKICASVHNKEFRKDSLTIKVKDKDN